MEPTSTDLARPSALFSIVLLAACSLGGCGRRDAEPNADAQLGPSAVPHAGSASAPAPSAAPSKPAPGGPATGSLAWTMPSTWKEMPARAMRKATYQATGPAGPAEITVFYFGVGQGGDVEANIDRWVKQFEDLPKDQARRDQLSVRGFHVSTVRVGKGSFLSGMPGGPTEAQTDWGMNAAVVDTPEGPYFFKMTGPSATVDAEEKAFSALLESMKMGP